MNRRIILGILLVLVGIAVVAAIANNAYHMGVTRGLAESGREVGPGAVRPGPDPYYRPYSYYGFHPFGFGFGFLFPLLFIFLIFALFKGLFWGWRGPYGGWSREEWHRREHESMKEQGQKM
jgi:hypothetical protein